MRNPFTRELWRHLFVYCDHFVNIPKYLMLAMHAKHCRHSLLRQNESAAASVELEQVANYDQVMKNKLAVFYALGIKALYCVTDLTGVKAIDLAPGPGHFTLCMQKYLGLESITGIDLSLPMIETANRNAEKLGLSDVVRFKQGDVTDAKNENSQQYGLATMTFAAHHLLTHTMLIEAITEMERLVRDDGFIMIMDLARLPSKQITERFVALAGKDYLQKGLDFFYRDFYESMFAAWTVEEMRSAVEQGSHREWVQLSMHGLPTLQILFGLPKPRKKELLFERKGAPWRRIGDILPPDLRAEWYLTRTLMALGPRVSIRGVKDQPSQTS